MKILSKISMAVLVATFATTSAIAQNTVFGEGRTPIGAGEASAVRNAAKQEAMRDAVVKAIKDATAINADDPKFAAIVNEVAKQLRDVKIKEEIREGNDFVTRVEVSVDRRQIKNAIRGTDLDKLNDRSFSMLLLVDEFLTSTRDLKIPLREIVEYSYDAGSSFRDKSIKANSASASSKSSVAASSNTNASSASSYKAVGSYSGDVAASDRNGSVNVSERANYSGQSASAAVYKNNDSLAATASSQSAKASVDKRDVDQKSYEKESYKKLIEYQDASKPTSTSVFLSAFSGNLRDYDLRLLDSSITRSKFFGDVKISLSALQSSSQLAKFSEFARKSNSDFLLIGNSTVVAGDINVSTGLMTCVVTADVKAFATASSEVIAATTESTEAAGANIEACAGIASKKIADMISPEFASRALGYWADRSARGRQFTVELKGIGLPFPMRLAFAKAMRDIPGVTDVEKKEDGDAGVKVTLTMKGKGDAMEEIYGVVSNQAAFSGKNLDGKAEGELITICLNKCIADASIPDTKKKK